MNARKTVVPALVAVVFIVSALFVPLQTVSAAGLQETPPPTEEQTAPNPERLEQAYQRLLGGVERQAERLSRTGEVVAKTEERIAALKEKGLDTSALEEALANYVAKVGEAQVLHDQAAAILATHAGFDADGKVTDIQQAVETLKSAGGKMREAHRLLEPAFRQLLRALREFRRDNRPPRPEAVPQP